MENFPGKVGWDRDDSSQIHLFAIFGRFGCVDWCLGPTHWEKWTTYLRGKVFGRLGMCWEKCHFPAVFSALLIESAVASHRLHSASPLRRVAHVYLDKRNMRQAWKLWTGQASGKCEDLLVFNSIEKTWEIFIHIEHAYNHTGNFREREWVVTPFICISVISPTAKEHASLIVSGLRNRCWKKTYHDQPAS